MQSVWCAFLLFVAVSASIVSAQEGNSTDAQRDDLAGQAKSVSTVITYSGIKWQQPGGPTLVTPIWCRDCTYHPDGTKTRSGQVADGQFHGEIIRLVRDASGNVTERFVVDASTGRLERHDIMGPFGETEQKTYIGGKLRWRQTFGYDQYGHMTDWLTFDSSGKQESRTFTNTAKDGAVVEKSVWGANGGLSWQQTYDPETQVEHFTTFDQSGRANLTWTVIHGKVAAFWQPVESPSQFGDNFSKDIGDGNVENYACQSNGECEVYHIHYEYLDPKKRNPRSAEWRDSDGNLRFAAYCNYEFDSFRNWTYREVWVLAPDLRNRTLYETDFRTVTYRKK